ncbi:hypothetical protein Glove_66g74 [Diversispora epigaea]|uniref:Uncharacterized protein n=1 Tax=Diversispora epigaea TaxID=1348612 RepID=A0A397JEZ5_9GLOM|nr:hypothetical protein Glove_66g74 [Diversispora epigaea]
MSLYENIPEASILEIFNTQSTSLPTEYEKYSNETENKTENNKLGESVNFALDEKYLETIIEKLYTENTSETDSIFADDDLISEADLCGVWQIDGESIIEENGELKQLGVCSYHFNHDQKNLHDPGFKKTKNTNQSILR